MIRTSLQEELIRITKANGGEHLLGLLLAEAKECVNVFAVDDDLDDDDDGQEDEDEGSGKDSDSIEPSRSRLGGLPDLPEGAAWPTVDEGAGGPSRSAHFLCQLNFAEIPQIDGLPLPSQGYL